MLCKKCNEVRKDNNFLYYSWLHCHHEDESQQIKGCVCREGIVWYDHPDDSCFKIRSDFCPKCGRKL